MTTPDRREPPPLEVDLTQTEGYPTGRAGLEIKLRIIGLKVKGAAALPSPVMLSGIGVSAAAAIVIACVFGLQFVVEPLVVMIPGCALAILVLGVTTALAVVAFRAGHPSTATGGEAAKLPERKSEG
ncbi:hypothetical protein FB565_005084 [Actinoplanes lutulentus]|uniref:Uncharacterized protein n=1 Tax=Actinoplanes lutulentus TaxID=1287878 RepID=A0A327ZM76_9ACTN|nr:hypothetical protein [Actinoplanes lutulentus]MBB2945351.1 hypothetical protein [Actinoplanes lutulentus]RAK40517.1 hypothetical protein B0I29_103555 [Actinoplanes lutulentus]